MKASNDLIKKVRSRQNHSRTDWDAHFSRVRGSICFPVWGELP